VQLSSPHSQRAVSLQERQATLLREKIRMLEHRIMDMIRNVNENMVLSDKLLQWARTLFLNADPLALPQLIADELANQFSVPQVGIKVWGVAPQYQSCSFAWGVSEDAKLFATSLTERFAASTRAWRLSTGCPSRRRRCRWRFCRCAVCPQRVMRQAAWRLRLACWCWHRPMRSASTAPWAPNFWPALPS